jgi:hypothetical protein
MNRFTIRLFVIAVDHDEVRSSIGTAISTIGVLPHFRSSNPAN